MTNVLATESNDALGAPSPEYYAPAVDYLIRLEFFQGPMDLLLHLVARQEVSVEEVKMSELAEQYLQIVISAAETLDLERAGEYLVIASTLLAIKSKALLPIEQDDEEIPGDWSDENPFFEDLRARLKAYRQTQRQADLLRNLPQLNVDTFARRDKKLLHPTAEMMQEPEDVFTLGGMFVSLMKRIGATDVFRITAQPFAIVDFMVSIVDSLTLKKDSNGDNFAEKKDISFNSLLRLLRRTSTKGTNRTIVIGGFIAVLELMKRGLVLAEECDSEHFTVNISMDKVSEDTAEEFSSEFDEPEVETPQSAEVFHMDDYRADASISTPATQSSDSSIEDSESDMEVAELSSHTRAGNTGE